MQTHLPVAALVFQALNPADDGTPHSTNVRVSLIDPATEAGRFAALDIGRQYGQVPPEASTQGEWSVYSQLAPQNGAPYAIVDAVRKAAGVLVHVRFAWPQLPRNPAGYDDSMRAEMQTLQASVVGGFGKPPTKPDQVIRRPVN